MIPTPHIEAKLGEIAETVLMPGDPLRAKFIADNFLTDVKQYNSVRNMLGFTGNYKGKRVSVQGSGMGMPSIGIYSYELYNFYDVKNIIRVGTAGAISPDLKIRDLVIGMGACSDSAYAKQFDFSGTFAPIASYELLESAVNAARAKGAKFNVGNILSSDIFYGDKGIEDTLKWSTLGVLCVEMEAAALYMNAAKAKKNALCMLTISDSLVTHEKTSSDERQSSFTDMMEIALESILAL
ncbi:MAG: purine-nucleoside phosphorylase [Defluviitaleaceae bacterium]|nr:purine-nucleoside phosphorylase [Defluviitaleaceae bacterium]